MSSAIEEATGEPVDVDAALRAQGDPDVPFVGILGEQGAEPDGRDGQGHIDEALAVSGFEMVAFLLLVAQEHISGGELVEDLHFVFHQN